MSHGLHTCQSFTCLWGRKHFVSPLHTYMQNLSLSQLALCIHLDGSTRRGAGVSYWSYEWWWICEAGEKRHLEGKNDEMPLTVVQRTVIHMLICCRASLDHELKDPLLLFFSISPVSCILAMEESPIISSFPFNFLKASGALLHYNASRSPNSGFTTTTKKTRIFF